MYIRTRFCSLLVDACSEPGYSDASLLAWEPNDWQDLIDDLRITKDVCLRPDCCHIFGLDEEGDDDVGDGLSQQNSSIPDADHKERIKQCLERASYKSFTQKYPIIEKTCQINMLLSPIRQTIEQQIQSGVEGPVQEISDEEVQALFNAARDHGSFIVRKHLYRLFVPSNDEEPIVEEDEDEDDEGLPPQPILKNLEDLKEVLSIKPFNLNWLQGRIESLIWLWNLECFGTKQPYLEYVEYHDVSRREHYNSTPWNSRVSVTAPNTPPARSTGKRKAILETLKRRRDALSKNHGDDPLIESRKLAATMKENPNPGTEVVTTKNILHQGKKSNIVIAFDDSDDEVKQEKAKRTTKKAKAADDDDEDDYDDNEGDESSPRRVRLPKLPKKRRAMKSPSSTMQGASPSKNRIYTGPPPDEGIFNDQGNVIQRHVWNEEEIAALLSGLDKYGLGKWIFIKQEYGYILRNRTTVQLKDKFRNMRKNGELPDRFTEN
jgi:Myb-like DNA-binding domain